MKKIYILYDTDNYEVIATSFNVGILEEIICDMFFEEIQWEYYFNYFYYTSNESERTSKSWQKALERSMNYLVIYESEVI